MMSPPEAAWAFGFGTFEGARSYEPGRNESCPIQPRGGSTMIVVDTGVGVAIAGEPSPAVEFPSPARSQADAVSTEAANTATTKKRIVIPSLDSLRVLT